MDYTPHQLKEIERLAGLLTPASEISVLLDLKSEDFFALDISTHGHPARRAYMTGMARSAQRLRERNMELAEACAPAAIEQCFRDLKNMMNDL